uniref:Uncharacterized protein n=1 Tax=Arundo donax TaxID=35708 RepID=A0A0A9EIN5_ARUDO
MPQLRRHQRCGVEIQRHTRGVDLYCICCGRHTFCVQPNDANLFTWLPNVQRGH